MRARPSRKMLTPRKSRACVGEPYKRRRPRSLHNSTGDLATPSRTEEATRMPTYTRLDARSSVFFCNPCAEVL